MEDLDPKEKRSLVEQKRQEAFAAVCDALDARLDKEFDKQFEANGRTYELTSAEDCMVAYAQQMRQEIKALYDDIVAKNDYREEQAIAKLLRLFEMYEQLIALYAELRSYYPSAATRVESHIPSLEATAEHGAKMWERIEGSSAK